jgi:hypothetical protein
VRVCYIRRLKLASLKCATVFVIDCGLSFGDAADPLTALLLSVDTEMADELRPRAPKADADPSSDRSARTPETTCAWSTMGAPPERRVACWGAMGGNRTTGDTGRAELDDAVSATATATGSSNGAINASPHALEDVLGDPIRV